MSIFICKTKDCPHNGVSIDTGDHEAATALCGGCMQIVEAEKNA
jgi:hypothetical protein